MHTRQALNSQISSVITHHFNTPSAKSKIQLLLNDFFLEINRLRDHDAQWLLDRFKIVLPEHLQKMASINAPEIIKVQFTEMFLKYLQGDRGIINMDEVGELSSGDVIAYSKLNDDDYRRGEEAISSIGFLKLNGGLGTTMGCTGPKSSISVDHNRNFLDFIVDQILALQTQYHCQIPLILLNSYYTETVTEQLINERLPYINLLQHQVPRIDVRTGEPVRFESDPTAEWNPPGHGDLYAALDSSGTLETLLQKGIRYLFVSNSDNLGASIDLKILGYMVRNNIEFLMETTPKTAADRKGGTLVKYQQRLFLLERAQVSVDQSSEFENIERFQIFNTNNIWIDLVQVQKKIRQLDMNLPLIVNPKTVHSLRVDQLESAMGSAIGHFERSASVVVPRNRFMPVKSVADLMVLRSDAIEKSESGEVRISSKRLIRELPDIQLSTAYHSVAHFDRLVPIIPSLVHCRSFKVSGTVKFGPNVIIEGEVRIETSHPDGLFLTDMCLKNEELVHKTDGSITRVPLWA